VATYKRRNYTGLHYIVHLSGVHRLDLRKSVRFHFHLWLPTYQPAIQRAVRRLARFTNWDDFLYHTMIIEKVTDGTRSALEFWQRVRGVGEPLRKSRGRASWREGVDYWQVPPEFLAERFSIYPLVYIDRKRANAPWYRFKWYWDRPRRPPKRTVLTSTVKYRNLWRPVDPADTVPRPPMDPADVVPRPPKPPKRLPKIPSKRR
jgi:hypothetical protein